MCVYNSAHLEIFGFSQTHQPKRKWPCIQSNTYFKRWWIWNWRYGVLGPVFSILRLDNSNLYLCKFKWKFYERAFCVCQQTHWVFGSNSEFLCNTFKQKKNLFGYFQERLCKICIPKSYRNAFKHLSIFQIYFALMKWKLMRCE